MSKRMNAILSIVAIMVTACVGATVQPKSVPVDESAMGEPTSPETNCVTHNGVYCSNSGLCCPNKVFTFCPSKDAVYPANQVCSKHEQK